MDDARLERIEAKLDLLLAALNRFMPLLERFNGTRPMFGKKKV